MQIYDFVGEDNEPIQEGATVSLKLGGGNVPRFYLSTLHIIPYGGDGYGGMSVSGLLSDGVTWATAIDANGAGIAGDAINPKVIIIGADYYALRVDANQGQEGVTSLRAAILTT